MIQQVKQGRPKLNGIPGDKQNKSLKYMVNKGVRDYLVGGGVVFSPINPSLYPNTARFSRFGFCIKYFSKSIRDIDS